MFSYVIILVVVGNLAASLTVPEQQELDRLTSIQSTRPVLKSNGTGATYIGEVFDDTENGTLLSDITGIHSMTITYSYNEVESIQTIYRLSNRSLYEAPRRGGDSGTFPPIKINFAPGEYVRKLSGIADDIQVNQISVTTLNPRNLLLKSYTGPFGAVGKHNYSIEGYPLGFYGQARDKVYYLGIYRLAPVKKSGLWGGGYYSQAFDENPDMAFYPPAVKINKLFVYHGELVYAIQAEYMLLGGTVRKGTKYGVDEGRPLTVIKLDKDEKLTGVQGKGYTYGQLCQLTFVSKTANGKAKYYGPYGSATCTEDFSFSGNMMMGYYGSAASDTKSIDSFGIYFV